MSWRHSRTAPWLIFAAGRPRIICTVATLLPQLGQWISACSASVLPATKREGLPKTVIESMVHGIAPIVTATGGSPELVEDFKSGLVVPPSDPAALANAIVEMASDEARRREWGANARERIRVKFNVRDSIAQHKALYEELVC